MDKVKTPAEAKSWLQSQGVTVQEFARKHNLDPATCYQLLDGRKRGLRGKAHLAAVALGLKRVISGEES